MWTGSSAGGHDESSDALQAGRGIVPYSQGSRCVRRMAQRDSLEHPLAHIPKIHRIDRLTEVATRSDTATNAPLGSRTEEAMVASLSRMAYLLALGAYLAGCSTPPVAQEATVITAATADTAAGIGDSVADSALDAPVPADVTVTTADWCPGGGGSCKQDSDCFSPDLCCFGGCMDGTCRFVVNGFTPDCCSATTNASCDDKTAATIDTCDKKMLGGWTQCSHTSAP